MIAFRYNGRWSAAYATPLLAAMMRPVHQGTPDHVLGNPYAWDGLRYWALFMGFSAGAELPDVTTDQRIAFAVLSARAVYDREPFATWADAWISGKDRTPATALAALRPVPSCDRAMVAHWAVMAAAFPQDPTLPAQTAALIAAHLQFPPGTFDFAGRAKAAMEIA